MILFAQCLTRRVLLIIKHATVGISGWSDGLYNYIYSYRPSHYRSLSIISVLV